MISQPKNWESVQAYSDYPKLPVGAYVCRVLKVIINPLASGGSVMQLGIDIDEGEYKDFYRAEFAANNATDKKWKGIMRIYLPREDGTEQDQSNKRTFKGFVEALERSNPGYRCFVGGNFDEKTLLGKQVGVLFRNVEWAVGGRRGWAVRPYRCLSADRVRRGDFYLPKDKPLPERTQTFTQGDGYTAVEDNELPF